MSYQITLDAEEVTKLVAHDLKESYDIVCKYPEEPLYPEIAKAIKVVLQYYSSPSEYDKWVKSLQETQGNE